MGPKPFPLPIGIGTDICQVLRLRHIATDPNLLNSWARKVFTRHEWPILFQRLASGDGRKAGNCGLETLCLPAISMVNQKSEPSALQSQILHFLAGRWAAKEAVIKAHRHSRLFMHRISIIAGKEPSPSRIYALVDPPSQTVALDEDVARLRGLRGYGTNGLKDFRAGPRVYGVICNGDLVEADPPHGRKFLTRRRRIKAEERQLAEVSISHDGDYAMAVCMAVDGPAEQIDEQPMIIDDGSGSPIHEPEWADDEWLVDHGLESVWG